MVEACEIQSRPANSESRTLNPTSQARCPRNPKPLNPKSKDPEHAAPVRQPLRARPRTWDILLARAPDWAFCPVFGSGLGVCVDPTTKHLKRKHAARTRILTAVGMKSTSDFLSRVTHALPCVPQLTSALWLPLLASTTFFW